MGKAKFRVAHAYRGRRKRAYRRSEATAVSEKIARPNSASESVSDLEVEYEQENNVLSSASSKKLDFFGISLDISDKDENLDGEKSDDCFFIVQKSSINKMISALKCPKCLSSGLSFKTPNENSLGFAIKGVLFCEVCKETIADQYMCEKVGNMQSSRAPFEVNMRAVVAFRGIGCGHSAMQNWCGTMNMPSCLSDNGYLTVNRKINQACKETCQEVNKTVREAIVKSYAEMGVTPDDDGILEIGVSYDGSWQKRGHSSHNGIGIVIDLITGLPINYEVLSNFCLKCQLAPPQEDKKYEEWKKKHAPNCLKNYDGSANSMEMECAKRIWERSEETHQLRYTTILSDGDSKTYDNLLKNKVYGETTEIKKEECVNHVAKRMGTALNNLVSEHKAQKDSISGKGKLTKDKIIKIQNYFGRAIKDNASDIGLMKKRIFAILYHLCSNDQSPKHLYCPPGDKSWCFWQRALAKGQTPGAHKEHETLPPEIGTKMAPIFQRLTEEKLLSRCTSNRTQNNNESLHNLVWSFCPKRNYAGKTTIENAVCMAILQFSMGAGFREVLCKMLGFLPGENLQNSSANQNKKRLLKAAKASSDAAKKRRRELKFKKTGTEKKKIVNEGNTYKAGSFD